MADLRELLRRSEVTVAPDRDFATNLRELCHVELAAPDTNRVAEHPDHEGGGPIIDLVDERQRKRRGRERATRQPSGRRFAAVAAAVIALIVGASLLVRNSSGDDVDVIDQPPSTPAPTTPTTRPPLPDGLTGLPPDGATPSTPETGQLLANLAVPIWVYEDGRVISARWTTGFDWTGFLEQRLSPSGVELVRAEILANGPVGECGGTMGWYAYGDGERVVCERPGESTYVLNPGGDTHVSPAPDGSGYFRLWELPYGAPSWLPASAWLDPEPKPFVPSEYQLQIAVVDDAGQVAASPIDVPAMLDSLPSEATELLSSATPCPALLGGANSACFVLSTEDARQVAATLAIDAAGWDDFYAQAANRFGIYGFGFVPYLPHGSPVWCCGG
jgi:hypothetical protein